MRSRGRAKGTVDESPLCDDLLHLSVCANVCAKANHSVIIQLRDSTRITQHAVHLCVCVCVCVCVCLCVCVQGRIQPATCLSSLLFGGGAMRTAGIEPAPQRHEPGDSTTGTAPTTARYTVNTRTDTHLDVTQYNTTSGFTLPAATLYACVCGVPATGLPAFLSSSCSVSRLAMGVQSAGTWW